MNNRWVIPDIHGCLKTLKTLLEQQIQPTRNDELYFLGDYIDRGPDSKGVIDYIRGLVGDSYKIRLLMGNHEDYCIQAINMQKTRASFFGIKPRNHFFHEWMRHGGKEAMDSFGVKNLSNFPNEYLEWMKQLEYYIELDDYFIVHAGFNFNHQDPFSDKRAMLWIRDYRVDIAKVKNKVIIHGHVPVSLEFIDMTLKSSAYHFIDLDNGVYLEPRHGFGNLCALELNSRKFVVQPNLDL